MFFIQLTFSDTGKPFFLNPENIGYIVPNGPNVSIVTNIPSSGGGTVHFTVQESMEEIVSLIEESENPDPNAMIG
jgi:uncharacterized protein YlzI (FlbEa/FlbD family)